MMSLAARPLRLQPGLRLRPTYAAPTTAYRAAFAIAANKNISHIVLGLLHTIGRKNSIGGQNGTETPVNTAGPCIPIDNPAIVETERPTTVKRRIIRQSRVMGTARTIPGESAPPLIYVWAQHAAVGRESTGLEVPR